MKAPEPLAMPAAFTEALLARAPAVNFFQLCQLLERHAPGKAGLGALDTPADEPVRFRPAPGLGFPATEMVSCEAEDDRVGQPPSVRITFLGLYGVSARMPPHLSDDIALRRDGHEAVMAFLDIFNHRIATLFYRAWRKYRYVATWQPGAVDEMSQRLLCLAGFGVGDKAARAPLPPSRVLGLLGPMTQRTRSAEGLLRVLALALPGVGVTLEERHPAWIRLDAPSRLGSRARAGGLGRDHVLGRRIADRGSSVRITLTPTDAQQAHALLPDAPLHRELMSSLRVYVGCKVDVVLRMRVGAALVPALALGRVDDAPNPRLAWTTLLKPARDRVITIALGRYDAVPAHVI
jgi:type VI secretion system protein ImpH